MREKFASQADPQVLADVRAIAAADGRQLQAVIEEALRQYVAERRGERPRRGVLEHLEDSVAENRELFRRLAQ